MGEDRSQTRRRVTVAEAAQILGVTVEAVRGRIKRNTLAHEKASDGTVYVLLDTDQARPVVDQSTDQRLIVERLDSQIQDLRGEVAYLRQLLNETNEANRENRRIIAALTQRIPEIEAPREERESPEAATEGTMEPTPSEPSEGPQSETSRRSWLWWWAAWILSLLLLAPAMWVLVNLF